MPFRIKHHINSIFSSLTYIIFDDKSLNCWIIDVGDYNKIKDLIRGYSLKGVLLTHCHYDHIFGINELTEDYPGIPIYTNLYGQLMLKDPQENLSIYHDSPFIIKKTGCICAIADQQKIEIGENIYATAIFTPGHNQSCITWIIGEMVFTGDSYIPGVKTVTKLSGGNQKDAENSEVLIKDIAKNRTIFPGHHIQND